MSAAGFSKAMTQTDFVAELKVLRSHLDTMIAKYSSATSQVDPEVAQHLTFDRKIELFLARWEECFGTRLESTIAVSWFNNYAEDEIAIVFNMCEKKHLREKMSYTYQFRYVTSVLKSHAAEQQASQAMPVEGEIRI